MRVRVVVYAPDVLTLEVGRQVRARFSAEWSDIHCARYSGVFGPMRAWRDRSGGTVPRIEVDPAIGTSDALIVGAPLEAGTLAPPMRAFLNRPNRIPPVLGVFGTCAKRYPALGFEKEVEHLANSFGGPYSVIVSQADVTAAKGGMPRGLATFLDDLAPLVERPVRPIVLPPLAA